MEERKDIIVTDIIGRTKPEVGEEYLAHLLLVNIYHLVGKHQQND